MSAIFPSGSSLTLAPSLNTQSGYSLSALITGAGSSEAGRTGDFSIKDHCTWQKRIPLTKLIGTLSPTLTNDRTPVRRCSARSTPAREATDIVEIEFPSDNQTQNPDMHNVLRDILIATLISAETGVGNDGTRRPTAKSRETCHENALFVRGH